MPYLIILILIYRALVNKNQQQVISEEVPEVESEHDNNRTELTKLEVELCKQNFAFYDRQKQGFVERFELPMLLTGISNVFLIPHSLWIQHR